MLRRIRKHMPYLRRALGLRGTLLSSVMANAQGLRDAETLLQLGRRSYAEGARVVINRGDPDHRVTVGAYCSIAPDVEFMIGGNHRVDWVTTFPFRARHGLPGAYEDGAEASKGAVTVGNDVWIGRGAAVMSGVTIGDGAVVGARAVVAKDVRPYAIVVGNPAREIRRRFSDEDVERLLGIRWWEWPEEELLTIVPILNGGTVAELAAYAERRGAGVARAAASG